MSILGDVAGFFGADKAEDAQYAAARERMGLLREAGENYDPYMQNFSGSADILGRLYGTNGQSPDMSAFTASPGYQFRLGEGQNALESSAAARGGLFSGATGQALTNYGQNAASQEFDNYIQRLFGMSGMGMNAAGAKGNIINGQANVMQDIGNNQATRIMSQSNAIGNLGNRAEEAAMMFFGG